MYNIFCLNANIISCKSCIVVNPWLGEFPDLFKNGLKWHKPKSPEEFPG